MATITLLARKIAAGFDYVQFSNLLLYFSITLKALSYKMVFQNGHLLVDGDLDTISILAILLESETS